MASLTHVRMFCEHGWKKITALEAAAKFPERVQAKSGIFMCDLCHQYVYFSGPGVQTRHFGHSKDDDKSCPERANVIVGIDCSGTNHDLPIRLCITASDFELELGLLPIPEAILRNLQDQTIQISSGQKDGNPMVYRLKERLQENMITYVPIRGTPLPEYHIELSCGKHSAFSHWPEWIRGIYPTGTLFDTVSRKKIPYDADIQVGKPYYLLCAGSNWCTCKSISQQRICSKLFGGSYWYLYQITAVTLDEEAARFFLALHCRLTDQPISIQPIWPIYVESPYVIRHNSREMVFFVQGDVDTKCFPDAYLKCQRLSECNALEYIPCHGRQQLVLIGHSYLLRGQEFWRRLKYTYLWQEPLNVVTPEPAVTVTDIAGRTVLPGIANKLPPRHILCIQTPYDGTVVVKRKGCILERRRLNAETSSKIDSLQFDCEIHIFQGLDCVWSVLYQREYEKGGQSERQILTRLQKAEGYLVAVPHARGAAVKWLKPYPQIKQWLYQQIRAGHMLESAYWEFTQFIRNISE